MSPIPRATIRWFILASTALLAILLVLYCLCTANFQNNLPVYGSGLLSWVPASAETVTMTRGPYRVAPSENNWEGDSLIEMIQGNSLGPLSWGENWFREALADQTLLIALEIKSNFAKPSPKLNPYLLRFSTPYDAVHVLVFSHQNMEQWQEILRKIRSHASETEQIGEHTLWRISYDEHSRVLSNFFITAPSPGTLMYATDKTLLSEIERKLTPKKIAEAMSSTNPIFGRERWVGIRRYKAQNTDIASPLSKHSCWPDDKALGFIMKLKPDDKIEWFYFSQHSERAGKFPLVSDLIVRSAKSGSFSTYLLSNSKQIPKGRLWITVLQLLGPTFAL